jgi:hypothetical protein
MLFGIERSGPVYQDFAENLTKSVVLVNKSKFLFPTLKDYFNHIKHSGNKVYHLLQH